MSEYSTDIEQVKVSVMDCVVDWEHNVQINPTSGEVFDFNGVSISPPVVTLTAGTIHAGDITAGEIPIEPAEEPAPEIPATETESAL